MSKRRHSLIETAGEIYPTDDAVYRRLAAHGEPGPGSEAVCEMCGKPIVYEGPHWAHPGPAKPRHPAIPKGTIILEQERRLKVSQERLSHFQCSACQGWWSVGDAPRRPHWFCPWCGVKGVASSSVAAGEAE